MRGNLDSEYLIHDDPKPKYRQSLKSENEGARDGTTTMVLVLHLPSLGLILSTTSSPLSQPKVTPENRTDEHVSPSI